ncbi:hypothetical protein LPA44_13025 [Halobacterium sp. KA-4]|uniref:hypothetical protein n=1 Tax=Halobacterium sp. KA-4 TaxID=2896367 RepID=UPI001E458F9C|nr:hypothetical protein [Halobacterium sp. KA-4]MCD2200812.1 hypothetical protein [Halobacterium sp. KA-4]
MDGVDKSLAEHLINDYTNLRTVSWAATSDVEHLENKYDLDAHEFFKALGDEDVYRNEKSPEAGKLHVLDHRGDMEASGRRRKRLRRHHPSRFRRFQRLMTASENRTVIL